VSSLRFWGGVGGRGSVREAEEEAYPGVFTSGESVGISKICLYAR
jgi:hypothetical protein